MIEAVGNRGSCIKPLGRGLMFGFLAALPLSGLVIFFEATRPAELPAENFIATQLSSASSDSSPVAFTAGRHYSVTRFKGVSAELSQARPPVQDARVFSAADAEQVFAASPASLKVGFQSEFVTKDGRRAGLRIVSREPIADQVTPDAKERLMAIAPVSTARLVNFVWGAWLYQAELEDRGADAGAAVQKVVVQKVL